MEGERVDSEALGSFEAEGPAGVADNGENPKDGAESVGDEGKAQKILQAVNGILSRNDKIRSVCNKMKRQALIAADEDDEEDEKVLFMAAGKRIIAHYADRAGVSGGISGVPSMIPGIGTLVGLVGAAAVDLVMVLKYEFEMCLCLCHLAGFDIDDERIRQLAFALATVSSYDILSNKDHAVDPKDIVGSAFWDYSVRELGKHVIKSIARILCINLSRGMFKAVPVIGVAVGASFNIVMTKRTGECCLDALWIRRQMAPRGTAQDNADVVYDAEILD